MGFAGRFQGFQEAILVKVIPNNSWIIIHQFGLRTPPFYTGLFSHTGIGIESI